MENKIKEFTKRIDDLKGTLETEEATKTALIMPFFSMLGYDVFNPNEFIPEFTCDVGIKKGEKVDYAIKINNEIEILIEAKQVGYDLSKVDSQLARYFHVSDANIAIMTDGIKYRFYSDLEKKNVMDESPFFEFDLSDITSQQINEIEKFRKDNYDVKDILSLAENLKNILEIQDKINQEFTNPSDELVKILISDIHKGVKTKQVVDEYRVVIKKAYQQFINEKVTKKLSDAILGIDSDEEAEEKNTTKIVTTEEEIQAFQIIKSILAEQVDLDRLSYRDTESYFGILLDDNGRKWICRVKFIKDGINLYLNNNETIKIETLNDFYKYKKEINESLTRVI